jgi:hypothetical protein
MPLVQFAFQWTAQSSGHLKDERSAEFLHFISHAIQLTYADVSVDVEM